VHVLPSVRGDAPQGALSELRRRARAAAHPSRRPPGAVSRLDEPSVQARRLSPRGV